jgi:hypothetical protein
MSTQKDTLHLEEQQQNPPRIRKTIILISTINLPFTLLIMLGDSLSKFPIGIPLYLGYFFGCLALSVSIKNILIPGRLVDTSDTVSTIIIAFMCNILVSIALFYYL